MQIQVVKQFKFDSAHFLTEYVGKCANLHGHTYMLEIGVTSDVLHKGFVMDFGVVKDIINPYIEMMDHNMLNEISTQTKWGDKAKNFPTKTTAENMVVWLYHELVFEFAKYDSLVSLSLIRLWETPTSYAEWRAE